MENRKIIKKKQCLIDQAILDFGPTYLIFYNKTNLFFKKQIMIFDSHDKSITFTPNQSHRSFNYFLIFIISAIIFFLIIIGLFVYRYKRLTQVRKRKQKSKEKGLIPIDNLNTFCTERESQNELKEVS